MIVVVRLVLSVVSFGFAVVFVVTCKIFSNIQITRVFFLKSRKKENQNHSYSKFQNQKQIKILYVSPTKNNYTDTITLSHN